METQMRTLTKAIFGMAMLAGSALAIATPANAQSNFGFYFGNSGPSYSNPAAYAYGNRGGVWRWDPYLHRRVWIPARNLYRGRYDRDYDRDDHRGWDRGYRGR
jgi:hypothetical protein